MTQIIEPIPNPIQNLKVQVTFRNESSTPAVWERVNALKDAHLVMWYIGSHGFAEETCQFYKEHFLSKLSSEANQTAWLYDLTAWGALKKSTVKLGANSSKIGQINNLRIDNIRCICSSEIFQSLISLKGEQLEEIKNRVLNREFLWSLSKEAKDSGVTLGQVFNGQCPLLDNFYEMDASKSYSLLQYLEAFFIIEKILKSQLQDKESVSIVFALPNDETKYYMDETNAFQQDLEFYLNSILDLKKLALKVQIQFISFKYGDHVSARPYNAFGKMVKKIVDRSQIM